MFFTQSLQFRLCELGTQQKVQTIGANEVFLYFIQNHIAESGVLQSSSLLVINQILTCVGCIVS